MVSQSFYIEIFIIGCMVLDCPLFKVFKNFMEPLKIYKKMDRRNENLNKYKRIVDDKVEKMACIKCIGRVTLQPDLKTVRCTRKKCRKRFPISKHDFFNKSRLRIDDLLCVINLVLLNATYRTINSILRVNKDTVLRIKKGIYLMLKKEFNRNKMMIGGKDVIVEVDESKFGKRKYNRGHRVEGVWVFGGVEKTPERKIFLIPVERRDSDTLISIIRENIHEDSIICTDKWRSYKKLKKYGIKHGTVNHSKNHVNPITGVHINTIEGNWSGLKTIIPKRYRTKNLIKFYLLLFMIRRNYSSDIFGYLLKLL
jgi:transposase-like protein